MEKHGSNRRKIIAIAVTGVLICAALCVLAYKLYYITGELSFDRSSGFYDEPFYLNIQGGGRIFYTLDGSEPGEDSARYLFPIKISDASSNPNVYSMIRQISPHIMPEFAEAPGILNSKDFQYEVPQGNIDKATVVRAVRIDTRGHKSEVINAVYFVGMQDKKGYDGMGVVSIISDPDSLFDPVNGLYMMGENCIEKAREMRSDGEEVNRATFNDANYMQKGKKYRVPALVYFWDENKKLTQIENCRIGIQGHAGRHFPKKSFNIYSENGETLRYCGLEFKSLNLFSGSQDADTMMLDMMINNLTEEYAVATRHYTPVQVFVDGEYWGFYELAERFDESYFSHYYDIDAEDIVMLKRTQGEEEIELGEEADAALFDAVEEYAVSHDLSQKEYFDRLFEMIDYESFMDYYAIQLCMVNQDWPNDNFAVFRSRLSDGGGYNDGKFRYVLYDMNLVSKGYYDSDGLGHALVHDKILSALWENGDFRDAMNERILYMSENVFNTETTDAAIDEIKDKYTDAMLKEYARYFGLNRDVKDYRRSANKVKNFMYLRYRYIHGTVGTIEHIDEEDEFRR